MIKRALVMAALGCGSSAPAREPPKEHAPPAGNTVEILVANTEGAKDLVVTDDYLYWIGGGESEKQDIQRAPHRLGATATLWFDSPSGASDLVLVGDRLMWSQDAWSIMAMPRGGGTPAELSKIKDAPSQMLEHDGLVVAAYDPGQTGDARVFRVSDRGAITEIAKLPGGESPHIAFDPQGNLFVATNDGGGWSHRPTVIGRASGGKVAPIIAQAGGALLITVDGEAVYYVTVEGVDDTVYRLPIGAKKPQAIARNHENGGITALAVDDRYIYWGEYMTATTNGKLWRLAKTGGGAPQAIADCGETTRLVIYGPDLYWADARLNRIARIRR